MNIAGDNILTKKEANDNPNLLNYLPSSKLISPYHNRYWLASQPIHQINEKGSNYKYICFVEKRGLEDFKKSISPRKIKITKNESTNIRVLNDFIISTSFLKDENKNLEVETTLLSENDLNHFIYSQINSGEVLFHNTCFLFFRYNFNINEIRRYQKYIDIFRKKLGFLPHMDFYSAQFLPKFGI